MSALWRQTEANCVEGRVGSPTSCSVQRATERPQCYCTTPQVIPRHLWSYRPGVSFHWGADASSPFQHPPPHQQHLPLPHPPTTTPTQQVRQEMLTDCKAAQLAGCRHWKMHPVTHIKHRHTRVCLCVCVHLNFSFDRKSSWCSSSMLPCPSQRTTSSTENQGRQVFIGYASNFKEHNEIVPGLILQCHNLSLWFIDMYWEDIAGWCRVIFVIFSCFMTCYIIFFFMRTPCQDALTVTLTTSTHLAGLQDFISEVAVCLKRQRWT